MIYHSFAEFYDQLMDNFDYGKVSSFIDRLEKSLNKEFKNILELACGTGNLTTRLIKNNRKIKAIDLSEDMLSIAEAKLRNSGVELFKLDMRELKFDEKFDLILSICDSFNYIIKEEELEDVLYNSYDHLLDGGLLIFDLNTEKKFKSFDPVYVDEAEGLFYTWENFYDGKNKINTYSLNLFVRDGDLYERFYEEHYERAYTKEKILCMLKKIGFKNIKVFNNYDSEEDMKEPHRLVYVAEK